MTLLFTTRSYKAWKQHYSTALYFTVFSLVYPLISRDYVMWYYPHNSWLDDQRVHLINSFVLFPCTTLLYLAHMPRALWQKALHYLGWISAYALMEWVWKTHGEIAYSHGWSFMYSVLFDCALFFIVALHDKHPLTALPMSFGLIVALVVWFHVPI